MAVPKDKVKVALDTKYKGKSLSKDFKDSFATTAAELIEDEAGIDDYINNHDSFIGLTIAENDRIRTKAAREKSDAVAALTGKPKETDTTKQEPEFPDDTPVWAKALVAQNKALADRLEGFEKAKTTETLTQKFHKSLKEAGVPDYAIKYAPIPKDESEMEGLQAQLVADFKPAIEHSKTASFGTYKPAGSNGTEKQVDGKVDQDLIAFAKAKNDAAVKQQTLTSKN